MKEYLNYLWKRKRSPLKGLLVLAVTIILGLIASRRLPTETEWAIGIGAALSIFVWLGPIILVSGYGLKIKNPKPTFVEPKLRYLTPLLVVSWVIIFLAIEVIIALTPAAEYINNEVDKDTFRGNFIMSLIIFSSFFIPISLYMIWISTRYKKIVEYGTSDWHSIQAKRRGKGIKRDTER